MARVFIDGFESGGYDLYDASANASVISSAGKDMNGSYCLNLTTGGAYVYKAISSISEVYLAVLWRPSAPSDLQPIFRFQNGVSDVATLYRNNSTNKLQAYRGNTLIDTGTKTVSNDTTYLIEVYFKLANAGGRFVVKVDDVGDIDFTGDTETASNGTFNRIYLGRNDATKTTKAYFDNFIIDDADYPGDTNIQAIVPTGAGNTTEWTASAGANWECVDEIPKNDADYVSTTGVKKDTYVAGDMSGSPDSIKCVQIQSRSQNISFTNNLMLIVRSGGTDYESSNKAISAFKSYYHIWETNPADAAAWEEADVNAIEIGVKNNTGNNLGSYQALAQIEWAVSGDIDETGLSVSLTMTVSESDILNKYELEKQINLAVSVSSADILCKYELSRLVNITSEVSGEDFLDAIESPTVSMAIVVTETDVQDFVDTELPVSLHIVISCFDSFPIDESDLLINLTSTVTTTDLQDYAESRTVSMEILTFETDIITFEPEIVTVLTSMAVTATDIVQYLELIEILLSMTVSGRDGILADSRILYELLGRTNDYDLTGRTTQFYLQ